MVPYLANLDPGLLFYFAAHSFLNALTLVHEPRQRRVSSRPRQPASTLPAQAPLAIGHDHNGDGVGAGKMLGLASCTVAYVATTALHGPLAAHAAELMASVPVKLGSALGQNAGLRGAEARGCGP